MVMCGGLDWGAGEHGVCVLDRARGAVVARLTASHDAAGLAELITRLAAVAPAAELPIAIERPSGLLVDTLLAAGHPVVPIHPNVVKASRSRYRSARTIRRIQDGYLKGFDAVMQERAAYTGVAA